ncbi:MAG: oligosaccharide flippase family protein [Lachnospiraceae bacterium]|nr:oligosaccharide flippase family protein [Lachnospiraceae bacterium]
MIVNTIIKKYKSVPVTVKAGIWFTICNILLKGIAFITIPIFTRILSPEEYGLYTIYLSWYSILSIFVCLNLYYGVFNKAMIKFQNDRDRFTSSMQGLVLTLGILFFLIYFVLNSFFNRIFELSTSIMCLMFVEMTITPMKQFWIGRKRFEYKYLGVVIVSILGSLANAILGILFIYWFKQGAYSRIWASVLTESVIGGIILFSQFYKGKAFFHKEYWKYALMFNIPLLPHYLSGIVLNQGDRIVIQKILGNAPVALYSIAYNVSMISQLVTTAIAQVLTPWLYSCLEKKKYESINKRLRSMMMVVALLCFIITLLAPELVWIMGSDTYAEAIFAIPPIAASVFFIYMYSVYSNFEFYFEKRSFIAIASTVAGVLNVLLNILFVPMFGYVAAAYTTLFCYIIYSYSHYMFCLKICKKELDGKFILETKSFGIISVIVIFLSSFSFVLYKTIILRYLSVVIILTFIFIKRDSVIAMVKNE